jgi:hypothetical protein
MSAKKKAAKPGAMVREAVRELRRKKAPPPRRPASAAALLREPAQTAFLETMAPENPLRATPAQIERAIDKIDELLEDIAVDADEVRGWLRNDPTAALRAAEEIGKLQKRLVRRIEEYRKL